MPRRHLAAILVLALAACGDRPFETLPPVVPPAEIVTGAIVGANGTRLPLHAWGPAEAPQAVILALHGFGDTGDQTYAWAAEYWASRGILTYAPDLRGFGRNPSRQRWPGAATLIEDAVAMSRAVRTAHPDLPLVVVGHSMGGGITLAAAARGLDADGIVLAGPAITGGPGVNPLLRLGGWTLATLVPDRRFTGEGIVQYFPTDNREALIRAAADPLRFANPSSRELWGLVQVVDHAAAAAPSVTLPTLTLVGLNDQLVDPARIARVHATIPGGVELIAYPEGWHWLFRDRQAPRVWADVADFTLARRH